MSEDAIFIGVILNEDLTISFIYKIADFDTIGQPDDECNDFSRLNRMSMLSTLWEFFEFCVDANKYKADIENRCKKEKRSIDTYTVLGIPKCDKTLVKTLQIIAS